MFKMIEHYLIYPIINRRPVKLSRVKSLKCRECEEEYPIEPINVCEFCFGPLEVNYDYDLIRKNISKDKIKSGPLTIWRYKDLLPIWEEALENYIGMNWDKAIDLFQKCDNLEEEYIGRPTTPSKVYIERCESYKITPPAKEGEKWDGVFKLTKK